MPFYWNVNLNSLKTRIFFRNKSKMESTSKSKLSSPDKDKQNPSSKLNKSKTK